MFKQNYVSKKDIHKEFEFLVNSLDHGELRKQQIELSEKIADTINKDENGIFQAGTGIGKSFAYLIPAILSKRNILISTATKQLSSQIANKDLKILKDTIFPSLKYCELQGINNYVCMNKLENCFADELRYPEISMYIGMNRNYDEIKDLPDKDILPQLQDPSYIIKEKDKQRIKDIKFLYKAIDYFDKYEKNEISYKDFIKLGMDCSSNCAKEISVEKSPCFNKNKKCELLEICPYRLLCNEIEESQILVTNHAFVGACLSGASNPDVYPIINNKDLWIADEGHELEQYLIKSFSDEISTKEIREISEKMFYPTFVDKIFRAFGKLSDNFNEIEEFKYYYNSLERSFEVLSDSLKSYAGILKLSKDRNEQVLSEEILKDILLKANNIISDLKFLLEKISDIRLEFKEFLSINLDLDKINRSLLRIIKNNSEKDSYLFWLEYLDNEKQDIVFHSTNIKVGEKLQACIGSLDETKTNYPESEIRREPINLIALSATMKIGSSFKDFKETICADKSKIKYNEYDAGTVFDYKRQGILYIPNNIPDVKTNRDLHFEKFKLETVKLVNSSGGGALILTTTSYEADQIYELLNKLFGSKFNIINYKESNNRDAIIERFRLDRDSVLVGTKGFFQGIDIQGTSLRLVCINKIPFPTPNVITEAKSKIYQQEGKNAFQLTSVVPATQILLQAIGRLIRHTTDNGVVAIMDNRLNEGKFWLKPLIDSIPDFTRTSDFSQVDNFFRKMKQIL